MDDVLALARNNLSRDTTDMPAVFDKLGVHFDYPDNWRIEDYDEGLDSEVVQVVVTV